MTEKFVGFAQTPVTEERFDIHAFVLTLDAELQALNSFDSYLHRELTAVEHVKKNMLVLKEKAAMIQRWFDKRSLLYDQLLAMANQRASQVPVDIIRKQVEAIAQIDSALVTQIRSAYYQLQDLILTDMHELYAAAETNKDVLKSIDAEARGLMNLQIKLYDTIAGSDSKIRDIARQNHLQTLERAAIPPLKPKMGFDAKVAHD